MNENEIEEILSSGESDTLEFKRQIVEPDP